MRATFTLIDDGRPVAVPATIGGARVAIDAASVATALGWELKAEGLCRAGACVPVRDRAALAGTDGVDLVELARVLDRPLALDCDERTAYLGTSAAERGAALATLRAPDFTLPDLAGHPHGLAAERGRKVLLIAYASW